ncbi:MAG: polysaccharide deacetylase family protein [Muribaculaceae bacterium]|nr:polysaccharide deacetylase family protein [Muribaculaceae bacterium]
MLLPQERIPWILRFPAFRRDVLFRVPDGGTCFNSSETKPSVYLTFDDGPIPESTPWLLKVLAEYDAKATFFMVADNARRYPDLFRAVVEAGHAIGNHTYHHKPPFHQTTEEMLADVRLADETFLRLKTQDLRLNLFRPPHGLILRHQQKALSEAGYRIVMFDLNTLDYRADRTPEAILASVKANVRPGCIVNLHDSLKSIEKLKRCLPEILDHLRSQGYAMVPLPSG